MHFPISSSNPAGSFMRGRTSSSSFNLSASSVILAACSANAACFLAASACEKEPNVGGRGARRRVSDGRGKRGGFSRARAGL
jgi:hypothetical protein